MSDQSQYAFACTGVYFAYGQDGLRPGRNWQKKIMDKLDHLEELIKNCSCRGNKIIEDPGDFTTQACATALLQTVSDGVFALDASHPGRWPRDGFCRVYSKKDLGDINYSLSVDLFNVFGRSTPQIGHLGIFYNARDINNFDFVYLRQHSASQCFQTGKVINGQINWTGSQTSTCSNGVPPGGQWYNMKVVVNGNSADIFRDGVLIATQIFHFPARASGGMLVANGYTNLGHFRNFKITS